jgi:hypothetical protein
MRVSMREELAAVVVLVATLASQGCLASEPPRQPGSFPPPPNMATAKYPNLASCFPDTPCPGPTCADNVVGPPDGIALNMAGCPVLELTWTGGTIVAARSGEDIAIHIWRLDGVTRVMASRGNASGCDGGGSHGDGGTPFCGTNDPDVLIAVINGTVGDSGTPGKCHPRVSGGKAFISLKDTCNTINNVTHLQLSRVTKDRALSIDAVEALSFERKVP